MSNREKRIKEDIAAIENAGYTNVTLYDSDLTYYYYDAYVSKDRIEVRSTKKTLEWRELDRYKQIEDWFLITEDKEDMLDEKELVRRNA